MLLEAALPGAAPRNIGVLLVDPATDRGWIRMLREYDFAEDPEVLEGLESDLENRLSEWGAEALLQSLEDSLSNALRVSERQAVAVDAFSRVLDRLYREHVESVAIQPFDTHLPLYSLRAAAGRPGRGDGIEPKRIGCRAPEGMRLSPRSVRGARGGPLHGAAHSRWQPEPVPAAPGGLAAEQDPAHPAVRRAGRNRALHRQALHQPESRTSGEDEWRHEQIRLEPLNPEFEAWDVEPEDFAVVAEWLRVIE